MKKTLDELTERELGLAVRELHECVAGRLVTNESLLEMSRGEGHHGP